MLYFSTCCPKFPLSGTVSQLLLLVSSIPFSYPLLTGRHSSSSFLPNALLQQSLTHSFIYSYTIKCLLSLTHSTLPLCSLPPPVPCMSNCVQGLSAACLTCDKDWGDKYCCSVELGTHCSDPVECKNKCTRHTLKTRRK